MLEQTIQNKLREIFPTRLDLTPEELAEPRPFNIFGEDCILDNFMRQRLPLSIETMQSDEAFETVYDCFNKVEARAFSVDDEKILNPILFIQQGDEEPLAILNWELLINLLQLQYVYGEDVTDETETEVTKH
jgi:hypothetical protein